MANDLEYWRLHHEEQGKPLLPPKGTVDPPQAVFNHYEFHCVDIFPFNLTSGEGTRVE
jgi:hypothetical protein